MIRRARGSRNLEHIHLSLAWLHCPLALRFLLLVQAGLDLLLIPLVVQFQQAGQHLAARFLGDGPRSGADRSPRLPLCAGLEHRSGQQIGHPQPDCPLSQVRHIEATGLRGQHPNHIAPLPL